MSTAPSPELLKAAQEFVQFTQVVSGHFNDDLTSDGSPGAHRLVLPVYQWPDVEEANREATP